MKEVLHKGDNLASAKHFLSFLMLHVMNVSIILEDTGVTFDVCLPCSVDLMCVALHVVQYIVPTGIKLTEMALCYMDDVRTPSGTMNTSYTL